jgi:Permuted papain-like amidase enzyme, YaeF/YiiX, C92 family
MVTGPAKGPVSFCPYFCSVMTKWILYIFSAMPFALLAGCGQGTTAPSANAGILNQQLIRDAKAGIRTGDVILRSGKDFTSYRIRELSDKDKTYSHAGIALVKDSAVYIYHITPPDLDEPAADTAMRLETLEQFASPKKCFGFGIVRYQLTAAEINEGMKYLDSLHLAKTAFDHLFDLQEHRNMYCSEMVDNMLRRASSERISLTRKYFTKLQAMKAARYFHSTLEEVNKRAYISIDNIQLNPACTAIHDYVFLK